VKAGDIEVPAGVEIVNKDLVLANLSDKKSKLKIEMVAERGYGYLPSEERKSEKLGLIILDAIFSPVRRVNYKVETARVGEKTDLDKLVLEIDVDGTITPEEALKYAAETLISFFNQVVNPKDFSSKKEEKKEQSAPEVLKLTIEEIELPTRIVNALQKAGYQTVEKLVKAKREDLMSIKNLGKKSLGIILETLNKKGIKPSWE
jgi:DNA-directed RNA polymerase subunit alpha